MKDSQRRAMFAKKVKVAESSHNFRNLDNPNNEYGHYSSHDAVKGMNTTITPEQYNKQVEEIHNKINKVEKNGDKCCDRCYAKAKYYLTLEADHGEYRCGNHSKSGFFKAIRQPI